MVSLEQTANEIMEFNLPGAGIYANTGIYADVTNCDFFYISRNILKEY